MPVDVELDAAQVAELGGVGGERGRLGGVVRREAAEGLGGRARRRPVAAPAYAPVAVDVGAHGRRVAARLSVLAPEAVRRLRVDEAWEGRHRQSASQSVGPESEYIYIERHEAWEGDDKVSE